MARRRIDLTGQRFGRLTVIGLNEETTKQKGRVAYWNCKCECGNEIIVRGDSLRSGNTKSCGCYKDEMSSKKFKEKWQDEEFRQMKSELSSKKLKEKWQDEDFRQMQSDKVKEQWKDEEFRKMRSDKLKEKWNDEEFRQMKSNEMREMVKEKWQDEEFRQMKSDKTKEQWEDEEMKWKMGYKGGITPISIYLRSLPVVSQWKKDTYTRENNRCQLTGKKVHGGNSDVHHLYGFNMIVLEAHELHNIQVKPQIKDYTEEELHKLEEYVASWHKDGSNAVLLSEDVHSLFHSLYKYGNNTPEQFEEFRERYLAREFKEILK